MPRSDSAAQEGIVSVSAHRGGTKSTLEEVM